VVREEIVADGSLRELSWDVPIEKSSWVAVRILPSSHTNPVFVLVNGRPVRASRESIQWCLDGVEQCWRSKQAFIAPAERDDAKAAYAHARRVYRSRLAEVSDSP